MGTITGEGLRHLEDTRMPPEYPESDEPQTTRQEDAYHRHILECDECAAFPLNPMCGEGEFLYEQVKRAA